MFNNSFIGRFITENQQSFILVMQLFSIIDIIAIVCVGISTLLSAEISATILHKEVTFTFLSFIFIVLAILSVHKLAKINSVLLFKFLLTGIITIFIIYSVYLYFMWLSHTTEGTFSYRFISFHKTATLEDKLKLYQCLAYQAIDQYKISEPLVANYLESCPSYVNPQSMVIIQTPYNQIIDLVKTNLTSEILRYRDLMSPIPKSGTSSYVKYALIVLGVSATVCGLYFMISSGWIVSLAKNLGSTQEEIVKMSQQLALDSSKHKATAQNIQTLIDQVKNVIIRNSNVEQSVDFLIENITTMDKGLKEVCRVMNDVIRPTMGYIFSSLSDSKKDMVVSSLNTEQKEFLGIIRHAGRIIFENR
jgi:hypothetical protein